MIWFIVATLSSLCIGFAARWGVIGAIGSYVAIPVMMTGIALINVAVSEHGFGSFNQDLEIIEYGMVFYLAQLWYLPLPAIAFGLAIYWMRRARPGAGSTA